ncbi:MAG TPA: DUF1653 domain-containing protein [Rhizomicrobium sp.]|jgi:hypothetical protein
MPSNPHDHQQEVMQTGLYHHFKGGTYEVLCVAHDSETDEVLVIYRASNGRLWVRPLSMFTEEVYVEGERRRRFEPIAALENAKRRDELIVA